MKAQPQQGVKVSPVNDPWMWDRMNWLADNQPDYLREAALNPKKLFQTLDKAVQAAMRVFYQAEQKGADKATAREAAMSVLCPPEVTRPENQFPMSEQELEKIWRQLKLVT
jgi:hypothetical protein